MEINKQLLDKVAHLARLNISEEKAEGLMQEMSEILNWVEQLNEVDTSGVKPLTNMSHEVNQFREDKVSGHLTKEQALKNAPVSDQDFFKVPKVIE